MPTYVVTARFTEQGIKGIQDTCQRASAFKDAALKSGVKVREIYWTLGPFDGVLILEAPDDASATAALLQMGMRGNVQTTTSRAFDCTEMQAILAKIKPASVRANG